MFVLWSHSFISFIRWPVQPMFSFGAFVASHLYKNTSQVEKHKFFKETFIDYWHVSSPNIPVLVTMTIKHNNRYMFVVANVDSADSPVTKIQTDFLLLKDKTDHLSAILRTNASTIWGQKDYSLVSGCRGSSHLIINRKETNNGKLSYIFL